MRTDIWLSKTYDAEKSVRLYVGGIILIIVIRLRLYTKQVPLKVHIAFEGVINTIYMTNTD